MKRLLLLSLILPLSASTIHLELIDGDFSDNYLAPTQIQLSKGSNIISGSLFGGDGTTSFDLDLFSFTLAPGQALSAIRILEFSTFSPLGGSFLGIQNSPVLTDDPTKGNSFSAPIGFTIFTADDASTDLDVLPRIVGNNAAPPFFGQNPLPSGNYAIWLNETGPPSSYSLDFIVTPEPSTLLLLSLSSFLYLRRRI